MRSRLPLFVLLGCVSFTSVASAQQLITFEDAVRIALEQNVTLRRAQNNVSLQSTNLRQSRAARLPNFNMSSSTGRNWGLQFDLTTGKLETSSSDRFSLGANTSVTLFNGFQISNSIDQAEVNLAAQRASYERSEETVVFTVIQNYLQVILDQEQIRIREEDLQAQQKQLERITEFVRVGQRPISDQYVQEASVANAEAALLTAQRALQLSESRVIQTLQLDPRGEYTFNSPAAPEEVPLGATPYRPDDLLRAAYEQRSDLTAQELSIESSKLAVAIAKSSSMPRVSLSGGVNTSYSSFGVDPVTREKAGFGSQLSDNRSESVSLSVSVPIFNRLQTKSAVERAQVQLNNATLDLENLQQSIALEVRQAYLDYQNAVKRLDVTAKQVRSAQQALEVEQARYDVAASTLVELSQARSNFVNASSQRIQAIYQFQFQEKVIEYYQGILSPGGSLF